MRNRAALLKRIEKLEQRHSVRQPVLVWRWPDETDEAAIERHLAARPEDRARPIIVVGWREATDSVGGRQCADPASPAQEGLEIRKSLR
jgi:hypothetical protein